VREVTGASLFDREGDLSDSIEAERGPERVYVKPLRSGWAQPGQLTVGGTQAAQAQRTFPVPQVFTVTVDTDVPADGITAATQATVTWSLNGVPMQRTFDVAAGVSISGVADAITVIVRDRTAQVSPLSPTGATYGVYILMAVRQRPVSAVPVVLTGAAAFTLNGHSQQIVPVPRGASSVAVYSFANSAIVLELQEQTLDGAVVLDAIATNGEFIPLVAGAQQIVVLNGNAGAPMVTVVFGVDG